MSTLNPSRHTPTLIHCFLGLLVGLFAIVSDVDAANNPFLFSHKPPSTATVGRDLTIQCKAEENDEIEAVYLYYQLPSDRTYRFLRMKLSAGILYTAIIPKAQLKGAWLAYFILGIDTKRKSHMLFRSSRAPHRVSIQAARQANNAPVSPANPGQNNTTSNAPTGDEDTIYSASRREQRIQNAPSIVTVITASDIKSNGWRTLIEILRYVAGMTIDDNGHWANFGIRGVNPRLGYGEKVIVLLDGHNMAWRQFNRNYLNPSWVTVDNIKRIEIIRGPGSSLWGANAISGVINIITKTAHDLKGFQTMGGGSPISGTYFLTLQGGQELTKGINVRASFSLHRQNRSPILSPIKEFLTLSSNDYTNMAKVKPGVPFQKYEYVQEGDEFFAQVFALRATWKGLAVTFHQSRYDPHAPQSTFSQLGGDDSRFVTDRYFATLSWAVPFGSWGSLLTYARFDHYSFARGTVYEANPLSTKAGERSLVKMAARDARFEIGAQFSSQIISTNAFTLSSIAGAEYEFLDIVRWHFPEVWETNKLPTPTFQNHHFGAFLQLQGSFFQKLHLTLGGRFDYDGVYGAVFTPRAAIILTPGAGFYTKLLYGNAFKAPSYHDLYYFRKNAFYGNRSLRPESVHTFEVQVGWQRSRLLAVSVNGYLSLFRDLITYEPRAKTDTLEEANYFPPTQLPDGSVDFKQKDNTSALTTFGAELELRMYIVRGLSVLASGGVFFGHSGALGAAEGPLYYSPQWQANLTASYRFQVARLEMIVALGAQIMGPKALPAKAFTPLNSRFGVADPSGQRLGVPFWTGNLDETKDGTPYDPTLETPISVRTFLNFQVNKILGHFDIVLRLTNLLNRDNYDADDLLLYPQETFNAMLWLRAHY